MGIGSEETEKMRTKAPRNQGQYYYRDQLSLQGLSLIHISIEVDGKTYFSTYEFDIQGIFYTQFVNEEDAADVLFMRHVYE